MTTSRTDFNETWLSEMPQNIGKIQLYDQLSWTIKDLIKSNAKIIDLGNGLKKFNGVEIKVYWYEDEKSNILLGVELIEKHQGLIVNALAKNPKLKGPPYASDLYDAILNDYHKSIRIMSDFDMSEDAFKVWAKLLQQGHKISVYNIESPGQTFDTFNNVEDLKNYFQDNPDFRKYRYVLSESGERYQDTRSHFNTRRMRELSGMSLID
jgi:hypothetical protein